MWVPFTVEAVALRTYADNSWLNIMELNTAITDRAIIGFTNQPRLQVYSGTGLYGSYFRSCWAVHYWRLGVNKNLLNVREAHHLPFSFTKKVILEIFFPYDIQWNILFDVWLFFFARNWHFHSCDLEFLWPFSFRLPLLPSALHVKPTSFKPLFCTYLLFIVWLLPPMLTNKILCNKEVDDKGCVCLWDWVGGIAKESLFAAFPLASWNTLQVLSYAFSACPNSSQRGGSIWRLIIVSKLRAAPTTCIFLASSENPNAWECWALAC